MKAKDVYTYTNYRHFLRDYMEFMRQKDPDFSFRKFNKKAGIVSPSFLKHVIDGKRNLSEDGAQKFMKGFDIKGPEASFFVVLVLMNQAKSIDERNKYYHRLKKFNGFREICQLEKDGFEYYRKWYHPVVREMVALHGHKINAAWIASRIIPKVPVNSVKESLELLERLGLIEKIETGYQIKHAVVKGFSDFKNLMLQNYHKEMIELGKESLERFKADVRNVTSVTLSIPEEKIEEIKNKISQLREELLQMAVNSNHPDRVVQVNFQTFPLTEKIKREGEK